MKSNGSCVVCMIATLFNGYAGGFHARVPLRFEHLFSIAMGRGKNRAKKGAVPSDGELLEAAIAQAPAERDRPQTRSRATDRLINAVEARTATVCTTAEIRALLEKGAYVDQIGRQMMPWPLFTAAHNGDVEVMRVLLGGGAYANKARTDVQRLHAAVHRSSRG